MPPIRPLIAAALVLPLIHACATAPADGDEPKGIAAFAGDPRLGEKTERACFASTIDRFSMAGDRTVVVESSPSRQFMIEVFGSCFELRHAQTLGIGARTGCVTKGDVLIVSSSAFGLKDRTAIGPQRCTINAVYEWDDDAESEAETAAEETS